MRYDVQVSDGSHFELERDEPLAEGEFLQQFTMVYRMKSIRSLAPEESEDFDAVVVADWAVGPAQAEFLG